MSSVLIEFYNPLRGFHFWNIDEIWLGTSNLTPSKHVPNVNDLVIDYTKGFFRVIAVDDTVISPGVLPSYTPTLEKIDFTALTSPTADVSIYQRYGLYQPHIMQRIYLDTTVNPFTLTVDDRYLIFGTEHVSAKAFKGSDISVTGTVISQQFNSSGNLTSENVDLIRIDPNNDSIKRPIMFNSKLDLLNGEIVTLVTYNATGGVSGIHQFIVSKTNAIRPNEFAAPVIVDIKLITSYIDAQQLDLINVPANVPITGGDFQAMLLYNTGANAVIPVDGNKCKIHGLTNFNTALIGDISTIVLAYYPGVNEPIVNASNPTLNVISSTYRIHTVENVLDYSFKIYVVPVYNPTSVRYSLKYYLTSVNYDFVIEIPLSLITVQKQGGGTIDYSPQSDAQTLIVSVLLSDVFPLRYPNYRFSQTFIINFGAPTINDTPWIIDYKGNNTGLYGYNIKMHYSEIGYHAIDLSMGLLTPEDWLATLWNPLHAIFDASILSIAPTPTFFKLKYKTVATDAIPISEWNILINNTLGIPWEGMSTIEIVWLKESSVSGAYLTLGISPVMIFNDLA